MNQTLQRIDGSLKAGLKNGHLIVGNRLKNIVGRILPRRRAANADFDSDKLRCAQRVDHGLDAIMAAVAAGLLDSQSARLQIQIIMDEDQIRRREFEFPQKAFEGGTTEIHPVQRTGQLDHF